MLALCSFTHVRFTSLALSLHECLCGAFFFMLFYSNGPNYLIYLAVGNAQTQFTYWCVLSYYEFSCANVSVRCMHKLMHGSAVIKCRETNTFFLSLPASCHSNSACKQARCVSTHTHKHSLVARGTTLCVCMRLFTIPLLMCARALSLSFSENLFHPKHRAEGKTDLPKKETCIKRIRIRTLCTHTCRQFMTVCNVAASALFQFNEEKHKPKNVGGRRWNQESIWEQAWKHTYW